MSRLDGFKMTVSEQALWLYDTWGATVFPLPLKCKKPKFGSTWPTERPSRQQTLDWFNGVDSNIAVMLGAASDGVTVLDFDRMSQYEAWRGRFPELAEVVPTVSTGKGMHVYFRSPMTVTRIRFMPHTDMKASGYVLGPGSIHPDGPRYEWVIDATDKLPYFESIEDIYGSVTENTETTENTEDITLLSLSFSVTPATLEKISIAIGDTQPTGPGTRNRSLFKLCRELRALPEIAEKPAQVFKPIIKEWHTMALPNIRTKEFTETLTEFNNSWGKVKVPAGEGIVKTCVERAIATEDEPFPDADEALYDGQKCRLLLRTCLELHKASVPDPFWISTRDAAKYLDIRPVKAGSFLKLFVSDGLITKIEEGNAYKSPRYTYTGKMGQAS